MANFNGSYAKQTYQYNLLLNNYLILCIEAITGCIPKFRNAISALHPFPPPELNSKMTDKQCSIAKTTLVTQI